MCSTHSEPGGGTEVAEEEGKDKEVEGKAEEEGEAMKWWKGDETAVMKRVEVTGMLERILVLKRENKGLRRKRGARKEEGRSKHGKVSSFSPSMLSSLAFFLRLSLTSVHLRSRTGYCIA
jgi:hypothetical protein